ncbi:MAG: LON peptidase substrate-binding domain-containing protein [Thermodesulfobacteriota bacterium]|jgi:Lon protease-like protein
MDISSLDIKDVCNLNDFSGTIPLFPLSTVVFFPNTLLPLHVFEPRYKQMVHDVSNSEGIIGMALLKPGWEANYYGNPEVFDVVGMGRIVSSEVFGDGRINIVLYGLKRVKIIEVMKESPYRVARVELVENTLCTSEETYRSKIEELIMKWNFVLDEKQKAHRININTRLPLDSLTDALATLIFSNVFDKQSLLEEPDVKKRAETIIKDLQTRIDIISVTSRKRHEIIEKRNLN